MANSEIAINEAINNAPQRFPWPSTNGLQAGRGSEPFALVRRTRMFALFSKAAIVLGCHDMSATVSLSRGRLGDDCGKQD